MTAHFASLSDTRSALALRTADLRQADERRRLAAYVESHPDATPFHSLAWGEGVERGTGHQHLVLIAERHGTLCGTVPAHVVHSPLFGRALVSAGFGVSGGILADNDTIANALADAFWEAAIRRSCETAELRGGWLPEAGDWTIKRETYAGFAGPIDQGTDEDRLTAIPRKQRAEVRKGLANELEIRVGRDERDRADHYAVYAESVRNLGTPVFPRALFDAVLDAFGEDADILTVLEGERPVASVLSLYHRGTVMPYWGGGVWDARRLRANDIMYYALMNHAHRRGCTRFDFGRSKTGTGAFSFKKNWGFEPEPLGYAVRTADGAEPRDVNPLSPKYRLQVSLWQKLPLPIANRLGPLIARGLG